MVDVDGSLAASTIAREKRYKIMILLMSILVSTLTSLVLLWTLKLNEIVKLLKTGKKFNFASLCLEACEIKQKIGKTNAPVLKRRDLLAHTQVLLR